MFDVADGKPWFDASWQVIEAATAARRIERDTDWGADIDRSGLFEVARLVRIPWVRDITVEQWLDDHQSRTYIASLAKTTRSKLIARIENVVRRAFPNDRMEVPYDTLLWIATKK
jgi:hypothetical protein